MKQICAIIANSHGAEIAFDDWTLTDHLASRNLCTLRIILIAKPFAKAYKGVSELFASAFVSAPARVAVSA